MSNPVRVTVQISANSDSARGPELRPVPGGQGVKCDGAGQTFAVSHALPATASVDDLTQHAEFNAAVKAAAEGFSETILLYGPEPIPSPARSSKALLERLFKDVFAEAVSMECAVAMSCVDIQAEGAVSDRLVNAPVGQSKKETIQVRGQKITRCRTVVRSVEEAITLLNLEDAPPVGHLLLRVAFRSRAFQNLEGLLTVALVRSPPDSPSDSAATKLLKTDNSFKSMLARLASTSGLTKKSDSSLNALLHEGLQRNCEVRMVIFVPPRLGPRTRETLLLAEKVAKVVHSREKREAEPQDDWGISIVEERSQSKTSEPQIVMPLTGGALTSSPSFGCAHVAECVTAQVAAEDEVVAEAAALAAAAAAVAQKTRSPQPHASQPSAVDDEAEVPCDSTPVPVANGSGSGPAAGDEGPRLQLRNMIAEEQRKWEEFLANVRRPLADDMLMVSPTDNRTATPAQSPSVAPWNSEELEQMRTFRSNSPARSGKSMLVPPMSGSGMQELVAAPKMEAEDIEDSNELADFLRNLKDEVTRLHFQVNDLTQVKVQQQQQLDEYKNEVSRLRAELDKRPSFEHNQKENLATQSSPVLGVEDFTSGTSPPGKIRLSRDVVAAGPVPVRPPLDVIAAGPGVWAVQNTMISRNRQWEMQNCFMEDLRSHIVLGPAPTIAPRTLHVANSVTRTSPVPVPPEVQFPNDSLIPPPAAHIRSPRESNKEVTLDTDKMSVEEIRNSLQELAKTTPMPLRILAVGSKGPALVEDVQRMGPAKGGRPPTELIRRLKCPGLTSQSLLLTGAPDPRAVAASIHAHGDQLTDVRWSGPPSTAIAACTKDYHAEIFAALPAAACLQTLSITNSAAPRASLQLLAEKLPLLPALRELDLGGMELGPDGIGLLTKGLARCPRLEVLKMRRCGLGPQGARHMAHWLSVLGALKELDIAENCIGTEAATSFLAVVPLCPQLTTVNISANGLNEKVSSFWHGLLQRSSPEASRVKIIGF